MGCDPLVRRVTLSASACGSGVMAAVSAAMLWLAVACEPVPPATGASDAPPPTASVEPPEPVVVAPREAPARDPTTLATLATLVPPPWRDDEGALVVADHWLPGPARRAHATRDPAARLALDDGCRRCHAQAAHEHAGSQHAGAWASEAFQHAFTVEPRAFCQRCHAPEEDAATAVGEVSPAAASLGVGCVTCHVQPGTDAVWAAPRPSATATSDAKAPHPIARAVAFAGPQACAACHEFPFPDGALRDQPLAMQTTITEHARSAAADQSCADCHMPQDADGQRSHAFVGAYDRAVLARALDIEATRVDATTVRLRLGPGEVGHAVPTGDLLRRLLVEISIDGPDGEPAFSARRFLGRRFGPIHQANGITLRGELRDDRVGVGPQGGAQEPTFTLPDALADHPVRWRIVHQRVAQHSRDPRGAAIEGELEFASGVLD